MITSKLRPILNLTKLQGSPLYQILEGLMDVVDKIPAPATANTPKFVDINTSAGPQSVILKATVVGFTVIKDATGNAGANNITLIGTVDGVVNPVINTNFGMKRVYPTGGNYLSW